jgi:hypothetical protein
MAVHVDGQWIIWVWPGQPRWNTPDTSSQKHATGSEGRRRQETSSWYRGFDLPFASVFGLGRPVQTLDVAYAVVGL